MANTAGKTYIIGAGPLGLAIADRLSAEGKSAVLLTRRGKPIAGYDVLKADLCQPGALHGILTAPATVFWCAAPPYHQWETHFPAMTQGLIDAVSGQAIKLVYADNLYAYGPVSGPLKETTPERPTTRKGMVRKRVCERLLALDGRDGVRVAVARAADFFGPRVESSMLGLAVVEAALNGKPANVIGNPDALHTFTYIDDMAAAMITLSRDDRAFGQVWHVPNAPAVSMRTVLEQVARMGGKPLHLRVARRTLLTVLGWFTPLMRELREMYYLFEQALVVDHQKYLSVFGGGATPLLESLQKTVDAARQRRETTIGSST